MPIVTFLPHGLKIEVGNGELLSDAAERATIHLETVCGGRGKCGRCKVLIMNGDRSVSPEDRAYFSEGDLNKGYRMACKYLIRGDVEVFIPEESIRKEQVILEDALECPSIDPVVRLHSVSVQKPTLDCPTGDLERLVSALHISNGFIYDDPCGIGYHIPFKSLMKLPKLLRETSDLYAITSGNEILDVIPMERDRLYGVAVDIGTTTVVAYLVDLISGRTLAIRSCMNPQIKYGDDVLTRMTFCLRNPDGLQILNSCIVCALNDLIMGCVEEIGASMENVYEVVIVGNTAMHHIFFNLDTWSLGRSPYAPVTSRSLDIKARQIGIRVQDEAYVHSLPNIAGFVGADHSSVLLATRLWESEKPCIAIDIGTNGEISVGSIDGIASASCAAGPALEGGNLMCGTRAAAGVIDHISISDEWDVTYSTISNKKPVGLCGSAIVDSVSEMFGAGVINSRGRIVDDDRSKRTMEINGMKSFVIADGTETVSGEPLVITQNDIMEILYSKGAMYAGIKILLDRMNLEVEDIDCLYLAGAFGNYISPESAIRIGLLPEMPLDRIKGIGNAAGTGAKLALMNRSYRCEIDEVVRNINYVELAANEDFEREFSKALYLPNKDTSEFPQTMERVNKRIHV